MAIGFEIKAHDNYGWKDTVSGWSEGDPLFEEKAAEKVIEGVLKFLAKRANAPGAVTTVAGAIGEAIGAPIGNFIAETLRELMRIRAWEQLVLLEIDGISGVEVEIVGDFAMVYKIETNMDLGEDLQAVLAVIPTTSSTKDAPYFMRKNVLDKAYLLHLNYFRRQLPKLTSEQKANIKLTIDIDI